MDALAPMDVRPSRRNELPLASLPSRGAPLALTGSVGALLLGGIVGALLGGLGGLAADKWYESSAQLAVVPIEDPTQAGNPLEGASLALPMMTAVLQTGPAADDVIQSLGLARVYVSGSEAELRSAFWQHVSVTSDRRSGVVRITAEDRDPTRARDIALALADYALRRMTELWSAGPRTQRERLEARLDEISDALAKAEQEMKRFRERTGVADLDEQRRGALPPPGALPRLEVEHARRKRAIDENVAARDMLLRQIQQLRSAETRPLARIDMIDAPIVSRVPTRPKRLRLIGVGAVAGGGLAWLLEQALARRRRRRLDQVSTAEQA
jgi:uncharacterized protein involved in exopolysaccharide biosynthesis